MPYKPLKPCLFPGCINTVQGGYCDTHALSFGPPLSGQGPRPPDNRPPAASRGYDGGWRKIRAKVLINANIPHELWPLYDVHHTPDYNPAAEPDHNKYTLTPILHSEHSALTGRGKGAKSLQLSEKTDPAPLSFHSSKMGKRG
jgi:hypothetical protein